MQKKNHNQQSYDACLETPFASLGLRFHRGALSRIDFLKKHPATAKPVAEALPACRQILDYCSKHPRKKFDLNLEIQGTAFQKRVWSALQKIPAGEVVTYGDLAKQLNTSARAIGNACRSNPLPVVIPCHRVVAKNGLGGFGGDAAGGRTKIKKWLLEHEGVRLS